MTAWEALFRELGVSVRRSALVVPLAQGGYTPALWLPELDGGCWVEDATCEVARRAAPQVAVLSGRPVYLVPPTPHPAARVAIVRGVGAALLIHPPIGRPEEASLEGLPGPALALLLGALTALTAPTRWGALAAGLPPALAASIVRALGVIPEEAAVELLVGSDATLALALCRRCRIVGFPYQGRRERLGCRCGHASGHPPRLRQRGVG